MKVYRYELPFKDSNTLRAGLIIQNETGLGEIAPLPGWSDESIEDALKQLQYKNSSFAPFPSIAWGLHNIEQKNIPLPKLEITALLRAQDPEERIQEVRRAPAVKVKVGKLAPIEAVQRIKNILDILGNNPKIHIDINRAWGLDESLYFAKQFNEEDFDYLEEPVKNFEQLKQFCRLSSHPIAIDEHLREIPYPLLFNLPTLKTVVYKPTLLGTLFLDPSFIQNIQEKQLAFVLSSSYESSLGLYHIARLSHVLPFKTAFGLDTAREFARDLLLHPFDPTSLDFNQLTEISIG